ncbi:kinase-like domain-containing protein [Scenedesmus sp. NREL 46B-D3]|nr:kinase-like domain-containing protein [Scenedesmus sp. NREL 46B-D3]
MPAGPHLLRHEAALPEPLREQLQVRLTRGVGSRDWGNARPVDELGPLLLMDIAWADEAGVQACGRAGRGAYLRACVRAALAADGTSSLRLAAGGALARHSCREISNGNLLGGDCLQPCDTDGQTDGRHADDDAAAPAAEAAAPACLSPSPPYGMQTLDMSGIELLRSHTCCLEELGLGGSAKVVKAHWEGADVAFKVVHKPDCYEQLQEEGMLMASLSHSNLLAPWALVEDPEQQMWGILMPLYEDGSVHDALSARAKHPEAERVDIALKAASGVSSMHRNSIIHRDVKSSNLLCDLSDRANLKVVVADLGSSIRCKAPFPGCPFWHASMLQVDTFAFGILLWELAHHCMMYPNEGYTYQQLHSGKHVRDGQPPPLPEGWPAADTELMTDSELFVGSTGEQPDVLQLTMPG